MSYKEIVHLSFDPSFSDDISLEGLQQELEECKNDDVSNIIQVIDASVGYNAWFIVSLY